MNTTGSMPDSQDKGGALWERGEAWKLIAAAMADGNADALELGWSRYSDAMVNAALGVTGKILIPLDGKIDRLSALINRHYEHENKERAELRTHLDTQFDRIYKELDRLGGLEARVERVEVGLAKVEVRQEAIEAHGAPAKAVDELHIANKRIGRLEFWAACLTIAIAANALIYLLVISTGGGR